MPGPAEIMARWAALKLRDVITDWRNNKNNTKDTSLERKADPNYTMKNGVKLFSKDNTLSDDQKKQELLKYNNEFEPPKGNV